MSIHDRVAKNVDRTAVAHMKRNQDAQAAAKRREFLYGQLFRNVTPDRDVLSLRTENAAAELFQSAVRGADNRRQIQILLLAVDNRWGSVVTAFIKVWGGEHPIADTVDELWTLTRTTSRGAV